MFIRRITDLERARGGRDLQSIQILRADLVRTLKLLGCASVGALDRSYVEIPPAFQAP